MKTFPLVMGVGRLGKPLVFFFWGLLKNFALKNNCFLVRCVRVQCWSTWRRCQYSIFLKPSFIFTSLLSFFVISLSISHVSSLFLPLSRFSRAMLPCGLQLAEISFSPLSCSRSLAPSLTLLPSLLLLAFFLLLSSPSSFNYNFLSVQFDLICK